LELQGLVKKKQRTFFVGYCRHCAEQLLNNDSFVAFADKTLAHYDCMVEDDKQQTINKGVQNANGRKEEVPLF
jgi:hypothetical protein